MRSRSAGAWSLRIALLAALLVASGCGARVTQEQKLAAHGQGIGAGSNGGGSQSDNGSSGGDSSGGTATGADSGTGGAATAGSGGSSAASGSGKTTSADKAAAAAPSGGNGGATDVGVTGDTITLGNVSTLSGPVPGIFQGAVIGTQAAVAYANSLGGIYGRKLKVDVRDDQFDTGQNRAQTIDLLSKAFAFAGSFSLYDDAALAEINKSGIPDTTYSLSEARRGLPNNFSVAPASNGWRLGPLQYYKQKFPQAITAVGSLYGDIPSAKASHEAAKGAAQSLGYKFVYERGTQPTETDFTADVVAMRQAGVKMVFIVAEDVKATARLANSMAQQGFKPDAFIVGGVAYDPSLIALAGKSVEGLINDQQQAAFQGEDSSSVPEVALFNQWVSKVKPGYKPDLFATFGWSETRLLIQAMQAAGAKLTRASVIAQLKQIDNFDDHGMLAPAGPASKRPATCYIMLQVKNGKFERYDSPPPGYRCNDGGYWKP
ncbi:MAG: ABC transporter substrate-binding protein [Actinobacteria bacterium]|nr:ABC transporter substrate-binding protein [Actinomycetota bacterium]MBV9253059.1 ABC transporter substrate-binding protein [Actinomycetota bacterium]